MRTRTRTVYDQELDKSTRKNDKQQKTRTKSILCIHKNNKIIQVDGCWIKLILNMCIYVYFTSCI